MYWEVPKYTGIPEVDQRSFVGVSFARLRQTDQLDANFRVVLASTVTDSVFGNMEYDWACDAFLKLGYLPPAEAVRKLTDKTKGAASPQALQACRRSIEIADPENTELLDSLSQAIAHGEQVRSRQSQEPSENSRE